MLKSLFPKLRIVARDNVIRVLGDEEDMARIEEDIEAIRAHVEKYNTLEDEDILDLVKGRKTKADAIKDVLVYSISGRPIKSRSENQQRMIDAFQKNDMIFAVGPAGTGKTYLGIALAVRALKDKQVKRIILSRPAVEAGEKLGFLPGDMKEKIRSVSSTSIRCSPRHDPCQSSAGHDREANHTNCAIGFHARPHT